MALFSTGSDSTTARRLTFRIAAANVAVFILLNIAARVVPDNLLTSNLFLSSDLSTLLSRPWTIVTYSFCHVRPIHMCINMGVLFAIGYMIDKKRITPLRPIHFLSIYFLSAMAGGIVFVMTESNGNMLIGASSAVMGLTAALGVACHNFRLTLPFPGPVKISIIIFLMLVIGLMSTMTVAPEATVVHVAGIFTGLIGMAAYTAIKRFKSNRLRSDDIDIRVTEISQKMKTSGFSSLNEDERHILVKQSYISPQCNE